jgi:hypothetical protein
MSQQHSRLVFLPQASGPLIDLAAARLRGYLDRVATVLGVPPEAYWCDAASRTPEAYMALTHRLPAFPDRDLALLWDDEQGWALALEPDPWHDLQVLRRYGQPRRPAPERVHTFLRTAFTTTTTESHRQALAEPVHSPTGIPAQRTVPTGTECPP